jgi:hypothetical protein
LSNLIRSWGGAGERASSFGAKAFAASHLSAMKLTTQDLVQRYHASVMECQRDPNSALTEALASFSQGVVPQPTDLQAVSDEFFGIGEPDGLEARASAATDRFVGEIKNKLVEPIIELVNVPESRFGGAKQTAKHLDRMLSDQMTQLASLSEQAREKLIRLSESLMKEVEPANIPPMLPQFAQIQSQIFTLDGVARLAAMIKSQLGHALAQLESEQSVFDSLPITPPEETEYGREPDEESKNPASRLEFRVLKHLESRIAKLVDRVEQQLQHGILQSRSLRQLLADVDSVEEFAQALESATRATVIEDLKEVDIDQFFTGEEAIEAQELIKCLKKEADPKLLSAGGSTRVLLSIPQRAKSNVLPEEVKTQFEQTPTVIAATTGDVVTCYEVECIPLDNVSMSLLQDRPDSIDFASRLHSRTDISWCPLSSIR